MDSEEISNFPSDQFSSKEKFFKWLTEYAKENGFNYLVNTFTSRRVKVICKNSNLLNCSLYISVTFNT